MALRTALLLLAMVASAGAASCPAPSTSAIACYKGLTASNVPTTGGLCTCACGAVAATATSEDAFAVTSSAGCTAAVCATTYAMDCGSAAYQNASYATYAASFAASAPALQSTSTTGAICFSYTAACPGGALSPCAGITTGSVTKYGAFDSHAAATVCGLAATMTASAGYSGANFCNGNGCNAPGAAASAAAVAFPLALATAAAAAAAAIMV